MTKKKKLFSLVLIKPSHYDNDGYVIQWFRSAIPSNSLACLYGLALECLEEKVLGEDVELEIHAFDEINTHINPKKIISIIEKADYGMVMLIGVQSNQFPRALDIARPLREKNIKVAVGGFHVSGTMAMLKEKDADVQKAMDMGITLFAGEAEGRLGQVLIDASEDNLKPIYDYLDDLPNMKGVASPILPADRIHRNAGSNTSFDAGRGCPFSCSFCTIINVQGKKSRRRSPEDIEKILRANIAQGLNSFFITDDNFARNQDWEAVLDKLIQLREVDKLDLAFTIQVDTLCHKLPNFIEKCRRAGIKRVFIGLENINPDSLIGASKRQNKITDYREMLLDWKKAGVITYCGYILGFPGDTQESILRDIEIIKKELPIDILEFFYLTPLPGSVDHKKLFEDEIAMDEDLNKYDLNHAVTGHPKMSKEVWEDTYAKAWENYYTFEHIETILRRAIATGTSPGKTMFYVNLFRGCINIEKIHPLEGGLWRLKFRKSRRSNMPLENPFIFYPKYILGTLWKQVRWISHYARLRMIYLRVRKDPKKHEYMDLAIEPVTKDETETRELFQSEAAHKFVEKLNRNEKIRKGEKVESADFV